MGNILIALAIFVLFWSLRYLRKHLCKQIPDFRFSDTHTFFSHTFTQFFHNLSYYGQMWANLIILIYKNMNSGWEIQIGHNQSDSAPDKGHRPKKGPLQELEWWPRLGYVF